MRTASRALAFWFLTAPLLSFAADEAPVVPPREGKREVIELFNGKDLSGWKGHEKYWSVKDGVIVGRNEDPVPVSTYLLTERDFSDFRLTFDFKLAESEMHSGIAMWGRIAPEKGDPYTYAGHLVMFPSGYGFYDLYGRNSIHQNAEKAKQVGRQHDWNRMEILAQGNRIRFVLNGELISDWREPEPDRIQPAPIGLQLHSNKVPQEVQFKNLVIETFPEDRLKTVEAKAGESTGAVRPFNGQNLSGWKLKGAEEKSHWTVGVAVQDQEDPALLKVIGSDGPEQAELVNAEGHGIDIYSEQDFGSGTIDLEFMVPKGSNSGVYVLGEYEVQILDSYGKAQVGPGDVGGLYGAAAPRMNAAKAPGEWQTMQIVYQAPEFKDGEKVSNMKFVKVVLNGEVIHENVEMKGPTPSGVSGQEAPTGPLMFQGTHGPVAFRNIRITPATK